MLPGKWTALVGTLAAQASAAAAEKAQDDSQAERVRLLAELSLRE
jgi:hypothetical protein